MSNKNNLGNKVKLEKWELLNQAQKSTLNTLNNISEPTSSKFHFPEGKANIFNERITVERYRNETTKKTVTKCEVTTNKEFHKTIKKIDNDLNNNFFNIGGERSCLNKEEIPPSSWCHDDAKNQKPTSSQYNSNALLKNSATTTKHVTKPILSTPKQTITKLLNSPPYLTENLNQDSIINIRKNRKIPVPIQLSASTSIELEKLKKPGILHIFHHDYFKDLSKRIGSKKDVELLESTFKKFKVITETHNNLSALEIQNIMANVERKNFSNHSCVVFAILSHGERNDKVYASDGKEYSIYDDVIFRVIKNKTLSNKPKIFLVQACKGSTDPRSYHTDGSEDKFNGMPREILIFSSTFEGFVSYRDVNGTPFIRKFCSEFSQFGDRKNIHDIMNNTIKLIQDETRGLQIPTITHTMTVPYIFGDHV
ncbi:caspase-3-like isoform X2 [Condylostylus longicornis]|uniref:caspase-3-like isoform X2 n=1 Tax=Condylostylus longicornis TaxID=2530218 RepID=UPI00244DE139|nr:caspase-3-like isoform X2 [Condylostylus longicornis]